MRIAADSPQLAFCLFTTRGGPVTKFVARGEPVSWSVKPYTVCARHTAPHEYYSSSTEPHPAAARPVSMRTATLQQIGQLCRVPFGCCLIKGSRPASRNCYTIQRHFSRQSSLRTVAQARKGLLMRELAEERAELQAEQDENEAPSGALSQMPCQ